MVRIVVLLAGLIAACCAAAPGAQAGVVPVDLQSTVTNAVQEDPMSAVAGATATVTSPVRPAVDQVGSQAADRAGTPTPGTVDTATQLTEQPEYRTPAAAPVPAGGSGGDSSATDHAAPPRSRARGHGQTGSSAAHGGHRAALTQPPAPAAGAPAETASHPAAHAPRESAAASKQRPGRRGPQPPSDGGVPASSPGLGLSLGGFALLAIVLCLTGPRLRQRLEVRLASAPPVALVSLLERPG